MKNNCKDGVYQLDSGFWAYRFSILIDGRRISRKKTTDSDGKKLKTQKAAIKAREAAIAQAHITTSQKTEPVSRRTMKEVYDEYCRLGREDRAYTTKLKQDSLWENHISPKFGSRFVDEISVAEIKDYLSNLYYVEGYSYQYTEGFLKIFYLIFGQAYSRNYLDVATYNKLCVNKNSKIKMPKMKTEDDTEIAFYSQEELAILDEYFKGTKVETAYLLGRYCGLRINECFGLKWSNVDLENDTIIIDRQEQYQDSIIKLVSPKTHNSKRTLYICPALKVHLQEKAIQREQDKITYAQQQEQNRRLIMDIDGRNIYSTELVNCLPNGKLLTVTSFKYHVREIKKTYGIDFKFHNLRHTFGTRMAELNTPTHLLCNQMGHGNIHVTQRYYLAISKTGIDELKKNLQQL